MTPPSPGATSCLMLMAWALLAAPPFAAAGSAGIARREDLEIVDCLLPGQVRQLGAMTYLSPRRPTNTTAADCRIRGGEYVAFDRADLKSALKVWLPAAQAGDPEAQTAVAEIYERGVGGAPDYAAAVFWYRKAADQQYARALFNLGTLVEQGLGVDQDKLAALDLYRRSWGLPEDSVMYRSAAREQEETLRAELVKQIAEKDGQLQLLRQQLDTLQHTLEALQRERAAAPAVPPSAAAASQAQIAALEQWIAQLQSERNAGSGRLAQLSALRSPAAGPAPARLAPSGDLRSVGSLSFGRYYALIIGNQHYEIIESLQTPLNDAERTARILEDKYGFTVQVLTDSSDVAMLKALNDLNDVLKPEDNLLIYYAGHGARLQSAFQSAGYWLPINAEAPPKDTFWVPNEQVTAHLARLVARRVLVVADSCYAGLLSADPSYLFAGSGGYTPEYLAFKLPKRSRLLISSGGDEPVLDTGGGANSIFANAFIAELESNRSILPAPQLFARLSARVAAVAAQNKFIEKPEFKSIKGAGHELGDFFFVPKDMR